MLILTRRVGETVMIGEDVTVTVLRVKGNQVRLGVNAPKTSPCSARRSQTASSLMPAPPGNSDRSRRRARSGELIGQRGLGAAPLPVQATSIMAPPLATARAGATYNPLITLHFRR